MTDDGSEVIRTPDQRLRVFVSSTLAELAEERAAVERAITSLRLTPVMFELGARPHPPQELYRAYLAQSDIFIGLYWQRYGWIGPGMDISGLEDEFRLSGPFPRLMYLKEPSPEREERLVEMLAALSADGTVAYRTFRSTRELGRLVRDDLAVLLSERFIASVPAAAGTAPGVEAPDVRHRVRTLPSPTTALFGRADDIEAVAELLESPGVRLVNLTGPGGIGKTRLAVAVGERLDDRYPNGAVFVPLVSATDPDGALRRVAAAVGATVEGASSPLDVIVEHLAEDRTLLVLDNLEQVTSVASDLDQLISRCPGVRILTTSRTVLRIRAEREYPVGPLAVPALGASPTLDEIAELPAVRLFVDRARAARYDFALDADDAAAVADICRRLDGLPLAIEIAAARTRLLSPQALRDRLGDRLDALGSGPVDLPERQRTLRATVTWSIDLLDPPERELLGTLSVFVDGWTIDAAVEVAAGAEDAVLDLLDRLAGQSLILVDARAAEPRFRMLVAVREVAAELLAARADAPAVAERHARHYTAMAGGTDWPVAGQARWAQRLGRDQENIRTAIEWSFGHDIGPLPHVFRILWLYWQITDRMPEGRAWVTQLEGRIDALDEAGRAELVFTAGVTAVEVGDDAAGLAAIEPLDALVADIDDPYLVSAAQLARSWILPIHDDLDAALAAAAAALDGFRRQGVPFLAFAGLTVGMLELRLGDPASARTHLEEVHALGQQYGNQWLESAAQTQLATLAIAEGRFDVARRLLAGSVAGSDDVDLSTLIATFALVARAELALAEGDAEAAATALGAVDGLRARSGLRPWPLTRRSEAALAARVASALEPDVDAAARSAGAALTRRSSIDLVRH